MTNAHPITQHRQYELVTQQELAQLRNLIRQQFRYRAIEEAIGYLAGQPDGQAVRVKVLGDYRLKRMRESAIGYASRRGFAVKTRHHRGWLYLIKGE